MAMVAPTAMSTAATLHPVMLALEAATELLVEGAALVLLGPDDVVPLALLETAADEDSAAVLEAAPVAVAVDSVTVALRVSLGDAAGAVDDSDSIGAGVPDVRGVAVVAAEVAAEVAVVVSGTGRMVEVRTYVVGTQDVTVE